MKTWRALFQAEFRRAWPWLPWLLALHALMFCTRSGRGIQLSPGLAEWAEWGVWALSAIILAPTLWTDSPFRRECFLATRPVKTSLMASAKAAALLIIVALPFIVVDLATLVAYGPSSRVIALGTLQTALFAFVLLLAAFPLVWFWRGKVAATIAAVLAPVAAAGTAWPLHRHAQTSYGKSWASFDQLLFPPVLLLAIGLTAILLGLLLACRGRWGAVLRTLAFLPAIGLATTSALWLASHRPAPVADEVAPLVRLTLDTRDGDPAPTDQLRIDLPTPPPDPDADIETTFTKLVVNGYDFARWNDFPPGARSGGLLQSQPIQRAFRARFGDRVSMPEIEPTYPLGAYEVQFFPRDAAGNLNIELIIQETEIRWEVVGELPLEAGATLQDGDTRWEINRVVPRLQPNERNANLVIRQTYPMIWLGSLKPPRIKDMPYRFFTIAPNGRVRGASSMRSTGEPGSRSTLQKLFHPFIVTAPAAEALADPDAAYEPPEGPEQPAELSNQWRVVIVRAVPGKQTSYSWKSPEPIHASLPRLPRTRTASSKGFKGTPLEWLKQHPAPAAEAGADAADAWLAELRPQLRNLGRYERASAAPFIAEVGKLVAAYPDKVAMHLDSAEADNTTLNILHEAMQLNLTRDTIKRFPALGEDEGIMHMYLAKGWAADVAPYAARHVRLGERYLAQEILLADPPAAGFSEAEWLAWFRLYPTSTAFRGLREKVLPLSILGPEADRIIDAEIPKSRKTRKSRHHYSDVFNLALARGRMEAPQWLHEELLRWRADGSRNPNAVYHTLNTYFVHPRDFTSAIEMLDWFLTQDPATFIYDAGSGKYQNF